MVAKRTPVQVERQMVLLVMRADATIVKDDVTTGLS